MPKTSSSVLIIGHPRPELVKFGADFLVSIPTLLSSERNYKYPVTVLSITPGSFAQGKEALQRLSQAHPAGQRIVIHHGSDGEILRSYISQGTIFRFLPEFEDPRLERTIQEALEEFDLLQQNEELIHLVKEQNDRLKSLSSELEDRVKKRQKSLADAQKKLKLTHQRTTLLHQALVAVHSSSSLGSMEQNLNQVLSPQFNLLWTRILFPPQSSIQKFMDDDKSIKVLKLPLFKGVDAIGNVCFARPWDQSFIKEETSFLTQITEAISLATQRLSSLEQSENLKYQWEATFDAISSPLGVVDSNFVVHRANRSYANQAGLTFEQVLGKKCYNVLFKRDAPCDKCHLGETFRWTNSMSESPQVYEVQSQALSLGLGEGKYFLQIYADISDKIKLERQVLESAKMAELGTIGSSIAHELNNPLGGMLNFIQLIKMELTGEELYAKDIDEMEAAAQKCKTIVESLLGFSRKPDLYELKDIDLQETLQQAIQIVEIKSKSLGVKIQLKNQPEPTIIRGRFNLISQALHNLLQNSFEAISERVKSERGFKGVIIIEVLPSKDQVQIQIVDNGIGLRDKPDRVFNPLYSTKDPNKHAGLGLSVAKQIIEEHGGSIALLSGEPLGTKATVSLPRTYAG